MGFSLEIYFFGCRSAASAVKFAFARFRGKGEKEILKIHSYLVAGISRIVSYLFLRPGNSRYLQHVATCN